MKITNIKNLIASDSNSITSSKILKADFIDTPIGNMISIADGKSLYLLEFINRYNLEREIEALKIKVRASIELGQTSITELVSRELSQYFMGNLSKFATPIELIGTDFQKEMWKQLQKISYGETYSYKDLANFINKPKHFRAVAKANSTNKLAIIVPCHRVINSSGALGGYASGLGRKQWLIDHEKMNCNKIAI